MQGLRGWPEKELLGTNTKSSRYPLDMLLFCPTLVVLAMETRPCLRDARAQSGVRYDDMRGRSVGLAAQPRLKFTAEFRHSLTTASSSSWKGLNSFSHLRLHPVLIIPLLCELYSHIESLSSQLITL